MSYFGAIERSGAQMCINIEDCTRRSTQPWYEVCSCRSCGKQTHILEEYVPATPLCGRHLWVKNFLKHRYFPDRVHRAHQDRILKNMFAVLQQDEIAPEDFYVPRDELEFPGKEPRDETMKRKRCEKKRNKPEKRKRFKFQMNKRNDFQPQSGTAESNFDYQPYLNAAHRFTNPAVGLFGGAYLYQGILGRCLDTLRSIVYPPLGAAIESTERWSVYETDVVAEAEALLSLLTALRGCNNYSSMLAVLHLYVRKYLSESVTESVTKYIETLFFTSQAGDEFGGDDSTPMWLKLFRDAQENWVLCKGNRLFSHFSKLLSLLVSIGLCQVSDVQFSLNEFVILEPDMQLIHSSAFDLLDAAVSTVNFFVENLYLCFQKRSLRPLFLSDSTAVEMDEEFAKVTLWWDLVKNGNLERVAGVSESEFDSRLEKITTKIRNLMETRKGFEKKLLSDKFTKLLGIKNDYITMKISSGVRKAPFVIELFGESSQGKTTFGDQIVDALLKSAGLPLDKEFRASYNASDKFMSNWTTNKEVLFIDDMANDKSDFAERPPTRVIIDVCNNQPFYANMADLASKGKVFVEPSIVVVSTNIMHLDAYTYSNCPYSIQRRMNYVITVKAKDEFQRFEKGVSQGIDPAKIRARYSNGENPLFDDIWLLTVSRAVKPKDLQATAQYENVFDGKTELVDVPFRTVLQFLIKAFTEHRKDQDSILSRMKVRDGRLELCGCNGCNQIKGFCDLHSFENQAGYSIDTSMYEIMHKMCDGYSGYLQWLPFVPIPKMQVLLQYMVFGRPLFRSYILLIKLLWFSYFLNCCFIVMYSATSFYTCFILFVIYLLLQRAIMYDVEIICRRKLVNRPIFSCAKEYWRKYSRGLISASLVLSTAIAAIRMYRACMGMQAHGALEPKTQKEVDTRDAEENPWIGVAKRELPLTPTSKCISNFELSNVVQKNLVYGTVETNGKTLMANALFLRSNVVLLPSHYFESNDIYCQFRKAQPDMCGGRFRCKLSKSASVRVPNTDFMICYAASGGSFKDLSQWLPVDQLPMQEFSMLWRDKMGDLTTFRGLSNPKMTANGVCPFLGGEYHNLSTNTFKGLCGATLISHGSGSCIMGFHLGGRAGTKRGCYGLLTLGEYNQALVRLRDLEGVLLSGTAELFEKQVLGVSVVNDKPLHKKSPLNYMPEDSQVEYFGSCPGEVTSRSDVTVTPISPHVMEVMSSPNIYCGPKMKPEWFGWQKCLENLSVPAEMYDYDTLQMAVRDYKSALTPIFRSRMWRTARPLNDHENLCGIPGKKFMDAIKLNTALGFPLTGKKRDYVTELEPTEEKPNNRVFDQVILDEIERCENCYRKGHRAYAIAKACKKDEILAKEKCRIFYGNPIALTYLIRKYYLPLLRVLQMNPLVSECAVGINSHGPEWEEFHQHVFTFGENRLLGGDYGKYDQKLPSQLILAALRILNDFARECDYSEADIRVMEAMAGDIAFAIIAYNGDLIGLTEGAHISGNSLTVIINGICGSLNLRACFYTLFKPPSFSERKPFRDFVKLMTYGDDNIGSVSPEIEGFTIKTISDFLAKHGQTYTMPDKESELLDFLPKEEFEFLKRKSVYCKEKGVHVGALIDKSIFKMLHMYLRPKKCENTPELACALNIDTALREWANHGREVYEKRRVQLTEVARRADITHLCTQLDIDFDESVFDWKCKYMPDGLPAVPEEVFEVQCDVLEFCRHTPSKRSGAQGKAKS